MQKFMRAIFGFLTLLLLVQELIPQTEAARVRVARVRKGRHDKRQTQQQLHGFTDVPLDSNYDRRPRQQQQPLRPEDNPYNARNRNVDYPIKNPNDDGRYNAQAAQQGARKPAGGDDDHCEGCDGNGIPGEAGVDYPIYATLPKTSFDCKKQEWPGYYADTDAKCQVFWICQKNKGDAFLCPNGTLFNQQVYVCDWWYNVDCSTAPDYYTRNQYIYAGPGIDLFGNQITVKQSVSVSGGDTRRPVSQTPRPVASAGIGTSSSIASNRNGQGQSTREILQAIESGSQTGTGGNAYRREINHRDDNQGSYSTPSITGSSRTGGSDINYQSSTYSSRETATSIPYETYVLREKPSPTTKRYSSEELSYGSKRSETTYAPRLDAATVLSPSSSKSYAPRENQIQNPFVKQSQSASARAPETSSRRTTSVSSSGAGTEAGPLAPLKQQHNQYTPQPQSPPSQSQYSSSQSPAPAKHYTPPPPLHQTKYKDNYAVPVKTSYATESGAYLPTTTARSISSSAANYNNPFIVQNKYQSSSTRPNPGSDNYYTTTKKNVVTPGFENDHESGFKFNFAKTISYSPSVSAASNNRGSQAAAPTPYRSHYNGSTIPYTAPASGTQAKSSTIFATTIRPNSANVYHHNPIPTIVQTTTRRPSPSTIYDGVMYAAKAIPQQLLTKVNEQPSTTSREVSTYSRSQDVKRSGEQVNYYQTHKALGSGSGHEQQAQDDYYQYRQQQQQQYQHQASESRNGNYPSSSSPSSYETKDKYATTTVSNPNNFQGDKIVSKYNTKTSYNEGDDENYVELLRSLARIGKDTATLAPVVEVHHRYDPETSATIASPIAVHTWDFTATTTSTQRPPQIVYETTATTTAAPTFGKKIKSGRKRNTSNWQNYFFKSKS